MNAVYFNADFRPTQLWILEWDTPLGVARRFFSTLKGAERAKADLLFWAHESDDWRRTARIIQGAISYGH